MSPELDAFSTWIYYHVRNMDVLRMKEACFRSHSTKSVMLHSNHSLKRSKRGHQLIVAASPPTEEAVVATELLTREDLIAYLASGCKSKEKWRIGKEHEKFGFEVNTLGKSNGR